MWLIDKVAEQKIQEAEKRGEFENLPNAGQALDLQDWSMVPEELRAAYHMLRNAGYLPPEMEGRKELVNLQKLLLQVQDEVERRRISARLNYLLTRLGLDSTATLVVEQEYYKKLQARCADND